VTAERWLRFCRGVAGDIRGVLREVASRPEREPVVGIGEGGDETTVVDRRAEDAVLRRLDELHAEGAEFRLVSEELGERVYGDPGDAVVVVDPIDGSLNAKRLLPYYCISLAFATGPTLDHVQHGYVRDFGSGEEWVAQAGGGATVDGRPLGGVRPKERFGVVALEATNTALVTRAASRLDGHTGRIRIMGAVALSLCQLADGRLDAVATLKPCRSVDLAAAVLVVREAGGALVFPDQAHLELGLATRTRAVAARDRAWAERFAALLYGDGSGPT
jgi:myo-inositol-1(or 4)-monophosphatase